MATPISIPAQHQQAIVELATLSNSERERLLDGIVGLSPTIDFANLVTQVMSKSELPRQQVSSALSLVHSLYGVADVLRRPLEDIVNDVIETISSKRHEALSKLNETQVDSIATFLRKALIPHDGIALSVKSQRLAVQHDRIYLDSEIFTDLRTVFQVEDPELSPAAMVVTHMLKIEYGENEGRKSLYIALDSNDLAQLRSAIDRAASKRERLLDLIKETGLEILESGSDI